MRETATSSVERLGRRSVYWLVCALMLLMSFPSTAQQGERTLRLDIGDQRRLTFDRPVARTALGNGDIVSAQVLGPRQLMITGLASGTTALSVWRSGRETPRDYRVTVRPRGARGMESEYTLAGGTDTPTLAGETESLARHAQARKRLGDQNVVDATRQTGPVQVQTDIRVVEVNRSKLQSAGFFFGKNNGGNTLLGVGTSGALGGAEAIGDTFSQGFSFLTGSGFQTGNGGYNIVAGSADDSMLGVISALRSNGFAYTLAEPSLVTLSGQSASFLAGGEFPFPVSNDNGDVRIEFKQFGVRLQLTPTVLDSNSIMLKVAPEVSELDFTQGVQASGVAVPALNVRRTDTTVQLGDGESLIISGLVSNSTMQTVDKFPGLGDLPIIGAFFRSTRFETQNKELVMVVTPHLVSPMAAGAPRPQLPGEALRRYDPSYLELLFDPQNAASLERLGNVGFSR
ncbi:pilus assembly protein CpaC [Chromohalobacter marismortui]|uniref:Pilus assembly protein CpaC n=1 Tax=Chromohalobacter marismortui TaxID=42055 RepID=A0A4R7NWF0_9GAMM|nr:MULTISPECIES: type II and III secretion system protein family protein [Chromohalobacter]MCI0510316.1 type II and III secretion system protein family protein [Chromohalobacter sp.]MCI0594011.1 type II and III secretion system protein family protein [Chromohalobacter sp.]TDU25109.1 pilus assembly protein CpaC [Chromohalobacter marismortui]